MFQRMKTTGDLFLGCYGVASPSVRKGSHATRSRSQTLILFLSVTANLLIANPVVSQSPQFVRAPGPPVEVGKGCGPILLADVDGDGHLDLVTKQLTNRAIVIVAG